MTCLLLGVQQPNVLVLDEPTNHLDLEGIEALARGLEAFEGTILFVSHDRWFVSRIATRVIDLTEDGISDHEGTYDEYLARQAKDRLDKEAVIAAAREARRDQRAEPKAKSEPKAAAAPSGASSGIVLPPPRNQKPVKAAKVDEAPAEDEWPADYDWSQGWQGWQGKGAKPGAPAQAGGPAAKPDGKAAPKVDPKVDPKGRKRS
jgi:energy-coupling factor transporter ATP-binding protein EcfA2